MYLGEHLRVDVDHSTNSQPELTVEEIKYSWGKAKCVTMEQALPRRREKKTFNSLLGELKTAKGLHDPDIIFYFYIEHKIKEDVEDGLHEANIERMKKNLKHTVVQ